MESKMEFIPQNLICLDCGEPFVWSSGERQFFWSKGLAKPKRCPKCREKRKATLFQKKEGENDGVENEQTQKN